MSHIGHNQGPPLDEERGGWSHAVTHRPPSTFAPAGTYRLSAWDIYRIMRLPEISPNGLGSAIQMNVFYINRAGRRSVSDQIARIREATDLLRSELQALRAGADPRSVAPAGEPPAVYPPPPARLAVGGRNGHNHRPGTYAPGPDGSPWWHRTLDN